MGKPRETDLKFTQSEVRHMVCLLYRNKQMPRGLSRGYRDRWIKDHESLSRKFESIDRRF